LKIFILHLKTKQLIKLRIMKKITLSIFVFLFAFVGLIAQNADSKWAIGLGPGVYMNTENSELGIAHEFYFSRYLSKTFDLRLSSNGGYESGGIDWQDVNLNLRVKLFKETAAVRPYLYGGGGYMWDNQNEGFAWNGGLGFKFPVSEKTSLFIEGGYVSGIEGERLSDVTPNTYVTTTDDLFKLTSIV